MRNIHKAVIRLLAIMMTYIIIYATVKFMNSDMVESIIPGWHPNIYLREKNNIFLVIFMLLFTIITYSIFKLVMKFLLFLYKIVKKEA